MSCFGGAEERLYLLELTVEKLKLPVERFKDVACGPDGTDNPIVVKIKFLDFPTFEIGREDFNFAKPEPRDSEGRLEFSSGRASLFVKQPRNLVREMQTTPLKVGVFCAGDTYPLAETEIPFAGCLCDQIAMSSNDRDHMPSYTLKGGYQLKDPGENPSGVANIHLRLSCLGKSVTTHYRLNPKSFFFKNDWEDSKYFVKRILPPGDDPGEDAMMRYAGTVLPESQMDEELRQLLSVSRKSEDSKKNKKSKEKKGKKGKKKKK